MICNFKDTTVLGIFIAALIISMERPPWQSRNQATAFWKPKATLNCVSIHRILVAETYVQGDFEAVGSEGFRRLADYIGGKNQKKESISMTAPGQPGYCIRKNCHDRPSQPGAG